MEYLPPNNIVAGACKDSLQTCRNAQLPKLLTRKPKSGKHKVGDTFDDVEGDKDNENVDEGNPVKENNDDESDSVKDHEEDDDVKTEGINVNIDEGNAAEDIN